MDSSADFLEDAWVRVLGFRIWGLGGRKLILLMDEIPCGLGCRA